MHSKIVQVRFGMIQAEWSDAGDLRVVRQDNGQHIELSLSEWGLLLRVAELYGWPTAPPASLRQSDSLVDGMRT